MNKKIILPILLSMFLFSGCTGGKEIFLQSIKKTAPESNVENVGPSFGPVNINYIDPYGNVLTTRSDMALYTYSKDSNGVSNCSGDCAVAWPPFLVDFAEDVGGRYSVAKRNDGSLQVTYDDMPLYTYTPDVANKVSGDGVNGVWDVVVLD